MTGRKPKPTHIKLVNGNPGHRPLNKHEPVFSDEVPEPPAWLPTFAKEFFLEVRKIIVAANYGSAANIHALTLLAVHLAEIRRCTELIEADGELTGSTMSGGDKIRVEVSIRLESSKRVQSLLAEFGLTPAAASRIVVPSKQKNNRFDAI